MKTQMHMFLSAITILMTLFIANCGSNSGTSSTSAVTSTSIGASCGTNMLQSQYGCLPQCSTAAVIYNGQCVAISGGSYATGTYTGYNGSTTVCSGGCGSTGLVQVSGQCLPQGTCGACYGEANGYCYIGDYAQYYYGY